MSLFEMLLQGRGDSKSANESGIPSEDGISQYFPLFNAVKVALKQRETNENLGEGVGVG